MALHRRRGISLLEVLWSMFVLLIGLMGVAALIPAGRFQILQGGKIDHAGMVGRAAFRDLKIRGYLNPSNWNGGGLWDYNNPQAPFRIAPAGPPTNSSQVFVAIDPLGRAASFPTTFPFTGPMTRIYPHAQASSAALADPIFRSGDDLIFAPNSGRDLPPIQQPVPFGATGPSILKRASEGNYSWLATIVTDPTMSALSSKVTVSVAVFYKRDLGSNPNNTTPLGAGETFLGVGNSPNLASGEIMFSDANLTIKPVKSGQWLMLSGTPGLGNNYYRWYRVAAADAVVLGNTPTQYVTVAGPDWNVPANATAAWVFETVVAVYEKNMRLEIP